MRTPANRWPADMLITFAGFTMLRLIPTILFAAFFLSACADSSSNAQRQLVFDGPAMHRPVLRSDGDLAVRVVAGDEKVLSVERTGLALQSDAWQPAGEAVTVTASMVDERTIRWAPVVDGGADGRTFSGLQFRFRIEGVIGPNEPTFTQFGYAKYAAAGVVDIADPLPLGRKGGIAPGFESIEIEPMTQGIVMLPQTGWWTGSVRYAEGLPLVGMSACSARRFKTRMAVGRDGDALAWVVEIGSATDPVTIPAGVKLTLDALCLSTDSFLEALDANLAAAFTTGYEPRPRPSPAEASRMFSTWHADFFEVTLGSIAEQLDALDSAGYLEEGGLQDFQIDDGYQVNWGDWLATSKHFGGTLTDVVAAIRKRGLRPGLWLAPGVVGPDSWVAREHPEWLLRRADGGLVICGFCSVVYPELYVLDWSVPEVPLWMQGVLRELQAIGFVSFKIDFLAVAAVEAAATDATTTSLDRYHRMLAALREAVPPPNRLWSATHLLLPTLGAIDGYRVSADLGFDFMPNLPTVNRMHYMRALSLRGTWLSEYGLIDPDAFFAREQPSAAARQSLAVLDLMSGGYYAVGDRPADTAAELNPAALPAELQAVLGTGIPFVAADPMAHTLTRWYPFGVIEEIFAAGGFADAQDSLYFRRVDETHTLVVILNWSPFPVATKRVVDLQKVFQRIGKSGDTFGIRALDGFSAVRPVGGSRVEVQLEGLGATVVEVVRR